jgi:hypothetical protein
MIISVPMTFRARIRFGSTNHSIIDRGRTSFWMSFHGSMLYPAAQRAMVVGW